MQGRQNGYNDIEESFNTYLILLGMPDPDLIIRPMVKKNK